MTEQQQFREGQYKAEVMEQGQGTAIKSGNPQLTFRIKILAWVNPAGQEKLLPTNPERKIVLTVTENTKSFIMERLRHAGFTGRGFAELQLVGRIVEVNCKHESYKNKPVERWELGLPFEAPQPIDDMAIMRFDAMFAKELLTPHNGQPRQPAAQPTAARAYEQPAQAAQPASQGQPAQPYQQPAAQPVGEQPAADSFYDGPAPEDETPF